MGEGGSNADGSVRFPLFRTWLLVFYAGWGLAVVFYDGLAQIVAHGGMAFAMLLGSYFAGSTPMGGGTVGFPVLVMLFGSPTSLGRDFSFAVQSAGMTSAAIFILATRQPVAWPLLRWALLGACVGTPLGLTFVAPAVSDEVAKLTFAVVWASFGILTLVRLGQLSRQIGFLRAPADVERVTGFATGFLGGAFVSSITGVGVDMVLYVVLVLARRGDSRVAIPTSVILMAATSLVGTFWQGVVLGDLHPDVLGNWLAAAPVVVLGAPFGALIATRLGRGPTLVVVAVLCIGQFLWTLSREHSYLGAAGVTLILGGLVAVQALFRQLSRWGDRLEAVGRILDPEPPSAASEGGQPPPRHSLLRARAGAPSAAEAPVDRAVP